MGVHEHRCRAPRSVRCAVLTVSDTRTRETDQSGARARQLLEGAGHRVVQAGIVPDEPQAIRDYLRQLGPEVQAVVVTGGTGLTRRDRTYETLEKLFEKRIDGFGELFRMLSWEQVGSAAMLSRATAGVIGGRVVFSLPGSTAAIELGMTKLILPELGHTVGLLGQGGEAESPG